MKKIKLLSTLLTLVLIISVTSTLFITADAAEAFEYDLSSITTEAQLNVAINELTTALNNGATNIVLDYGDVYYITSGEVDTNGNPVKTFFNRKVNQAIKGSTAADGSINLTIKGQYGGNAWASLSGNQKLKTVSFPESIIVASELFDGCTNLTLVQAPKATYVASSIFKGCTSLNLVILSASDEFNFIEENHDMFGEVAANVTLALNCNKSYAVTDNTWEGMQFNSIAYIHNTVSYTSSGASLEGNCSTCSKKVIVLTINAPKDLFYDGSEKEATITSNLYASSNPKIVYKSGDTVLPAPPTEVGNYTANVTLGGATASVSFTITKMTPSASDFTITPPENSEYDGTKKSPEITVNNDVLKDTDITVKYYDPDGNPVENPVNPGEYTIKVDIPESNVSTGITDLEIGEFTIKKRTVTVTAEDKTVCVNGEIQYSYITEGFIGNDTFTVAPTISADADCTVPGEYVINIGGASANSNYDIKYVNGILTVKNHSYDSIQKYDVDMHKHVCDCGDFIYEDHDWDEGEITKPATCTEEGKKFLTCTICGEKTEEIIDMSKHADKDDDGKCDSCSTQTSEKENDETTDNSNVTDSKEDSENSENSSNDSNASNDANDKNDTNDKNDENSENSETDAPARVNKGCKGCKGCKSSASLAAVVVVGIIGTAAVIKKKE